MLSLLLLEDAEPDAFLVVKTLRKSGMNFRHVIVKDKAGYLHALEQDQFDAILADNSLPQFSAMEALEIYNDRRLGIPFLLVTGSISEEFAVEMMKRGASDYVLKDRLQRLPNAVMSSIQKYRLEFDRRNYLEKVVAHETLLKEAAKLAHFGSWETDLEANVHRWSDEQFRILGYEPREVEPSVESLLKNVHPEDVDLVKQTLEEAGLQPGTRQFEYRIIDGRGQVRYVSVELTVKLNSSGKPVRINGYTRDISEAKIAGLKEKKITEDLIQRNKDLEQFTYIVSHNLRAPVANIIGVSEILAGGQLQEDEQLDFLQSLSISVRKLDEVISDLNNILQAGRNHNENKEPVDFAELVEDIKWSIQGADHGVSIITDFTACNKIATIRSYLHSIFYNLISNSIKFRKAGVPPEIKITSRRAGATLVVAFTDNGIGLDIERKKEQLFGLYKRFHPDLAEGKGMGLFMVKTQVEAIGGKISMDSKVGTGTTVEITFPLGEEMHPD